LGKIVSIRLLPAVNSAIKSLDRADEIGDMLTSTAGKEVAKQLKDVIRQPLAKHPSGIGASGKSYSAVKYRKGRKSGVGKQEYIIYEDGSGANEKIRTGINPGEQGSKSSLRSWAVAKRIPLKHPDTYRRTVGSSKFDRDRLENVRSAEPVRYISKKQKRRIRPYKSDVDKFTAAIDAIYGALAREGTHRPPDPPLMGAAWWRMYPSGQGRFDYVAFVVRLRQPTIRSMISDASEQVRAGLLSHALSGWGGGGMSKTIRIGRYVRG